MRPVSPASAPWRGLQVLCARSRWPIVAAYPPAPPRFPNLLQEKGSPARGHAEPSTSVGLGSAYNLLGSPPDKRLNQGFVSVFGISWSAVPMLPPWGP